MPGSRYHGPIGFAPRPPPCTDPNICHGQHEAGYRACVQTLRHFRVAYVLDFVQRVRDARGGDPECIRMMNILADSRMPLDVWRHFHFYGPILGNREGAGNDGPTGAPMAIARNGHGDHHGQMTTRRGGGRDGGTAREPPRQQPPSRRVVQTVLEQVDNDGFDDWDPYIDEIAGLNGMPAGEVYQPPAVQHHHQPSRRGRGPERMA